MKCPFCSHEEDKVIESRPLQESTAIRRRRECLQCGGRFTSYERVEERRIMLVKRDGRREEFNREKVLAGIIRACEKRPVSMDEIEKIVDEVGEMLYSSQKEVETRKIGEFIMDRLEKLDEVAYVRFASVYRRFQSVSEFLEEIKELASSN